MPGETTQTELDWNRLQGRVLDGGYQLESILSADAVGATFKVRILGDSSANTVAKMFGMEPRHADEQIELWRSARNLKNRDLLIPLGAGKTEIDGATVAYLVIPRPDEMLDEVVRQRPLSQEEAGEVLSASIHGLDELHSHGLVHGALSPEHIVALGDAIKLSVENIGRRGFAPRLHLREPKYRAPESAGQYVTPEADVWCLGATLIEVLSQQPCGEDCISQAMQLPAPFDGIARRCLDPDPETRPKLGQVEAMFRSGMPREPEPKKFEVPVPVAAAVVPAPAPEPARAPVSRTPASEHRSPSAVKPGVPGWAYAAVAAAVIVLALVWMLRPKHRAQPPPQAVVQSSPQPSQPSAWESKTLTPEDAKTVTPRRSPKSPASASAPSVAAQPVVTSRQQFLNGQVWRVVLFTYARAADADAKARWVNQKYPGLSAESFSPDGKMHLVVVGGRMTREDAERLRQRARSMGLPRDSYIQNYKQ